MKTKNTTIIAGEVSIEELCRNLDLNKVRFCATADEHQIPSSFSAFNLGHEEIGATRLGVYAEDGNGDEIKGNSKWFYRGDNPRVDVLRWNDEALRGVALFDEDGERHEFYFLTAFSL
jgi:hypothetical protein